MKYNKKIKKRRDFRHWTSLTSKYDKEVTEKKVCMMVLEKCYKLRHALNLTKIW